MKRSKPAYELHLEDRELYTDAKLLINERIVARTTLDLGTKATDYDAQRFVDQYFHRPSKPTSPRKPRRVPMTREITDVKVARKRYPRKPRHRNG